MSLDEQLTQMLEKLNQVEQYKYKAKLHTNAKGEAQFEVSVRTNESPTEIQTAVTQILDDLKNVCSANGIKVVG